MILKLFNITLMLFFLSTQTKAARVLGIDFYSNQLSPSLYQFHANIYSVDSVNNFLSISFDEGTFADTTLFPDTCYQVGINIYKSEYTINHSFSFSGIYKIAYWSNNWESDIINLTNAVTQPSGDTAIIVNSPFITTNQFTGFNYELTSGTLVGNNFIHDLSITETDNDSIVINQVGVGGLPIPMIYEFPAPLFASSENIISNLYHCNAISMGGRYAVEFAINEYRMGILIASHHRIMTFAYNTIGFTDLPNENDFVVSPNPSDGIYSIQCKSHNTFFRMQVFNYLGETILESENLDHNNIILNLTAYSNGIYFVTLYGRNEQTKIKLVKQ